MSIHLLQKEASLLWMSQEWKQEANFLLLFLAAPPLLSVSLLPPFRLHKNIQIPPFPHLPTLSCISLDFCVTYFRATLHVMGIPKLKAELICLGVVAIAHPSIYSFQMVCTLLSGQMTMDSGRWMRSLDRGDLSSQADGNQNKQQVDSPWSVCEEGICG